MISVCGEAIIDLLAIGPTTYEARPGGSPANTAVALARLGVPVAMLGRFSTDRFGRQLREHLVASGVDLSCAVDAPEPGSLAIVSRDEAGDASYRFVLDGTADWQWEDDELVLPAGTDTLHTGSLALSLAPAVERLVARTRCTVSIDPNLRPGLLRPDVGEAVERWLPLSDIWKASAEDVALLHPGEDVVDVARRWAAAGPGLVLVTGGAGGVTAVVAGEVLHVDAHPTDVVDTLGAGDTFTAGLLAALHDGAHLGSRLSLSPDDVRGALDLALRAAAVTCSRPGADPPYAHELV
ncbi:MAG: carbohydrate kinase [Actinobacteria bacterium]|nr:carbohydrate kinase [Actinomycetota bacterium]MCA1720324.1 carbohydrate kinase [Actinomycetota bacterium]